MIDRTQELVKVRQNIFTAAHTAIGDWPSFPWHVDQAGRIQAWKSHSSQALAIDVFGTLRHSTGRDAIVGELARRVRLPPEGPWAVRLEWTDPDNLLCEPRPTQVDVLLESDNATIVVECKFTEPGGSCSQTRKLKSGKGAGLPQCNGRYEMQTNPRSEAVARCALTAKGIRYWAVAAEVLELDADASYAPCPFKGEAYQWMRNLALAHELARTRSNPSGFVVAYADGPFVTATHIERLGGLPSSRPIAPRIATVSYQAIVQLGRERDASGPWEALEGWVDRKIETASARGHSASDVRAGVGNARRGPPPKDWNGA
jgi:hypothetical protein